MCVKANIYQDFYLDDYLNEVKKKKELSKEQKLQNNIDTNNTVKFNAICKLVEQYFESKWDIEQGNDPDKSTKLLEVQKKAIMGHSIQVKYFKDIISEYLKQENLSNEWFPNWYRELTDAIYQENWGLAGISQWLNMNKSSSAKIIGENIYFLIDGKMQLQEQKISKDRFNQLKRALIIDDKEYNMSEDTLEVYLSSGERIKIFDNDIVKKNQPSMIFRKTVVDIYTFEEQAKRGTIPNESIDFFKAFSQVGYNVNFMGQPRAGKSTFLSTWQSYENNALEGITIETDDEIPFNQICPNAPIIQLILKDENANKIMKDIKRSDADYIIMAEARDGLSLSVAVEMANIGTSRCKSTVHLTKIEDFCYDIANQIISVNGGNLKYNMFKVAKSFHYVLEFTQLEKKDQKRLKGIYEIRYNPNNYQITIHTICNYDPNSDSWMFKYDIGQDKKELANYENKIAFNEFEKELKKLSELFPYKENNIVIPYQGEGV